MSVDTENNSICCSARCWSVFGYTVAILGSVMIILGVNQMLRAYTVPVEKETREARSKERKAERQKLQQSELSEDSYGWVNESKGIARLPVERGMELIVAEYSNPKTARKKLGERLEKATAQPPKAPEAPSAFE